MNKEKSIKINVKRISDFLLTLNDTERIYIQNVTDFANSLNRMIKKFNLDKKRFCEIMEIKMSIYGKYISGAYNYSLIDFAKFNAAITMLEEEEKNKI